MQTLHEYMMATKAVEYIIAVVFLAAFVGFWQLLTPPKARSSDKKEK